MERRLNALARIWEADAQSVSEASYDIEWALKWPSPDPAERAARIVATHGLDGLGMISAAIVAHVRCGVPRGDARLLAELGLERLLEIAARPEVDAI